MIKPADKGSWRVRFDTPVKPRVDWIVCPQIGVVNEFPDPTLGGVLDFQGMCLVFCTVFPLSVRDCIDAG